MGEEPGLRVGRTTMCKVRVATLTFPSASPSALPHLGAEVLECRGLNLGNQRLAQRLLDLPKQAGQSTEQRGLHARVGSGERVLQLGSQGLDARGERNEPCQGSGATGADELGGVGERLGEGRR